MYLTEDIVRELIETIVFCDWPVGERMKTMASLRESGRAIGGLTMNKRHARLDGVYAVLVEMGLLQKVRVAGRVWLWRTLIIESTR